MREDNPEYVEAVRQGLRVLPRSAALAAVMAGRRVLAVAGTHGKTTTTSLLTVALQAAGADPTYAIGGDLSATGVNAAEGSGDLFVAEADESDGAFLVYAPYAAIVTNVEADHLDQWGTEEAYRAAFDDFADTLDPDGFLVCVVDDPGAAALAERAPRRGSPACGRRDLRARRARTRLGRRRRSWSPRSDALPRSTRSPRSPPGCASASPTTTWSAGLGLLTGTKRRMERKGEAGGVRVYDSYAHHPTEIARRPPGRAGARRRRAAWSSPSSPTWSRAPGSSARPWARRSAPPTRSWCSTSTSPARTPTPTSPARWSRTPYRCPPSRSPTCPTSPTPPRELVARARPGDLVLTLGAGTITELGPRVLELLGGRWLDRRQDADHGARPHAGAASRAASGPAAGWRWQPVVAVVLVLVLVVGGIWLVFFSSYLSVQGVQVAGIHQLSASEVRAAAAVPDGEPLARVDLDRIRTPGRGARAGALGRRVPRSGPTRC